MRIISGTARGTKLFTLEGQTTRPTLDRVKESMFNIIQSQIINSNFLDVFSGSGAIGISLAHYRKNIMVDLIDFYEKPEKISKKNIVRNNLENQVKFIKSDLLKEPIKELKKYDIIVSNPPYIKEDVIDTLMNDVKNYEPRTALSGGNSGLIFYERIVEESKKALKQDGILAFEIGYDQGGSVSNIMKNSGYIDINVVKDLAGLDRVVIGRFSP